jgi:NAD-dependent dihydropyrimidine dehydrogenase PreA subunit
MTNPEFDEEFGQAFFELQNTLRTNPEYLARYGDSLLVESGGEPLFRVLPRWKAIKDIPGVMPCEDLREILKHHEGRISSVRCICRLTMSDRFCAIHEGTRPEEGHCIKFDDVADHFVKAMGVGSYLSAEEVLALFDETEKSPIYHMIGNSRDVRGGFCNCCACCCDVNMGMRGSEGHTLKDGIAPSRFFCIVNKSRCTGCEICVKKCPFFAIRMTKDGKRAVVDGDRCMGCGTCVLNCPDQALKLKLVRPPEHVPETGAQHILNSLTGGGVEEG